MAHCRLPWPCAAGRCSRRAPVVSCARGPPAASVHAHAAQCSATTPLQPPRLLTSWIIKARSLDQLVCICSTHQLQLNPVHISAALSACVRHVQHHGHVDTGASGVSPTNEQHQQQHQQQQQRKNLQGTPLGLDAAGTHAHSRAWLHHGAGAVCASSLPPRQLHVFVAWLLLQLQRQPEQCGARELASVVWCLVKLRQADHHLQAVESLLARFADVAHTGSCQAVSMVLYSLAAMGYRPSADWLDRMLLQLFNCAWTAQHRSNSSGLSSDISLYSSSNMQHGHAQVHLFKAQEYKQQQQQHAGGCQSSSTQALANTLWATARLQQPAVARTWLLPLLSLLGSSTSCGTAHPGSSSLCHSASAQQRRGSAIPFQAVANVAWACAVVLQPVSSQHNPPWTAQQQQQQPVLAPPHCGRATQQLLAAVQQKLCLLVEGCQQGLQSAKPRELTMLLWACSRLDIRLGSSWWSCLWPISQQLLPRCSAAEAWVLLTALARLRVVPPASWMAQLVAVTQPLLADLSAGQASGLVWACGTLRVRPPLGWMAAAAQACVQPSAHCSPVMLSRLVWAMSKLGYKPAPGIMAALMSAVVQQLDGFRPHQLSKLLLGCATLHLQLSSSQVALLLDAFSAQLGSATPADVTMVLRALALWQPSPSTSSAAGQHQQWWQRLERARLEVRSSTAGAPRLLLPAASNAAGGFSAAADSLACGQLVGRVLHAAEGLTGSMTAAELCQCLWSAVRLQAALSPEWAHAVNHILPGRVQQLQAGDLCLLLWSLARVAAVLQPRRQLHKEVLLQAQRLMLAGRFSRRDLTAFMWSYTQACGPQAQLPRPWLSVFCHAACAQLPGFSGRQLGVLLKSLVLLRVVADPPLLEAACLRMELLSATLSRGELASISASLLQLQQWHEPAQLHAGVAIPHISPGQDWRPAPEVVVQLARF